jgi:hypothetical protein
LASGRHRNFGQGFKLAGFLRSTAIDAVGF